MAQTHTHISDGFERPVTYVRISVTDRCNFRCVYCTPPDGIDLEPRDQILTFEEIVAIVRALAEVGVRRARLTGGEPLVRGQLHRLIERLAQIENIEEVSLTTNAHLLERKVDGLFSAGLRRVNVSLDTLERSRFARITRGGNLDRVLSAIDCSVGAGLQTKTNTVVIRQENCHEIIDITRYAIAHGFVARFIEFMPIGARTEWSTTRLVKADEIREILARHYRLEPCGREPGRGPAKYWRLFGDETPAEGARVGIIGAVSECFCESCNRIRLTSQGGLRPCLADDREVDLRSILRSGGSQEDLLYAIRNSLTRKRAAHPFLESHLRATRKQMASIGG